MKIQNPVVAGMFYPADPVELKTMLQSFFAAAKEQNNPLPKAIIAPHAGYIYSGPIAASAYACLAKARAQVRRVIVIAPAHRYPFYGIATSSAAAFATPLGEIPVDRAALAKIAAMPQVVELDAAFAAEHALEVQLPFLQMQLKDFVLIPLLVGEASAVDVAAVLEVLYEKDDGSILTVVSSDLSHYHDYAAAQRLDTKTVQQILALDYNALTGEQACGHVGISGLLKFAAQKGWRAELIDLRNSGDTAGEKDQVVGYGAVQFFLS